MSWLVPSALAIAGIGILATIALHFIARSRPLAEPLPTARFIPQRPVRARTRSVALSDLSLLLVRLLALAALGLAVAGPVFGAARGRTARVIVADRSRAVGAIAEVRDSVRTVARPGDAVVAFDSAATTLGSPDSLVAIANTRGVLSAGIAAAMRVAASLAKSADSVELVIVSPLAVEEMDEATARMRAAWPGRARLVRVREAIASRAAPTLASGAGENDVVVAGLSLVAPIRADGSLRLARGHVSAADSLWARDSGHVLIHWPSADSSAHWKKRATIDAIGAVTSTTGTIVARFPRVWSLDGAAIARWVDGEVAATERSLGNGCIRDVGILFDPSSDVTLRAPFRAFVRGLLAPCGGERAFAPVDAAMMATLAGAGPLASAEASRDREGESSRWTPWLLAAAAALLILELAMRRSSRTSRAAVAP